MVGTRPVGFIFRYSAVLFTPKCRPASMRSSSRPSSSAAHSTFFTLTEFVLPQIFSMSTPNQDSKIRDRPRLILVSEADRLAVAARVARGEVAAVELPDELPAAELV